MCEHPPPPGSTTGFLRFVIHAIWGTEPGGVDAYLSSIPVQEPDEPRAVQVLRHHLGDDRVALLVGMAGEALRAEDAVCRAVPDGRHHPRPTSSTGTPRLSSSSRRGRYTHSTTLAGILETPPGRDHRHDGLTPPGTR